MLLLLLLHARQSRVLLPLFCWLLLRQHAVRSLSLSTTYTVRPVLYAADTYVEGRETEPRGTTALYHRAGSAVGAAGDMPRAQILAQRTRRPYQCFLTQRFPRDYKTNTEILGATAGMGGGLDLYDEDGVKR
jgi:hypothetical protein